MASTRADQIVSTHSVPKSESDNYSYRGLVLKNGLKVLVISDPAVDKSAAALDVQVGSMNDPRSIAGLAHFCEHMLFMGTRKYPRESHYDEFIKRHGGSSNAQTSLDHTCFYFTVMAEHLKQATDIFAQFFHEPLFNRASTEREVNALHSEYDNSRMEDKQRCYHLERMTGSPDHDFSKFAAGNRETLETLPKREGIDVRKALLDFHEKWYSSNIMSLCLIGKESLDDLSDMAVELFSSVRNKSVTALTWPERPFTANELCTQTKLVPVQDKREMWLNFQLPDVTRHYRTSPIKYINYLLSHEGEHSLLSYLNKEGWATSLISFSSSVARGFGTFTVQIDLSAEGLKHTDDIVEAVFQYLNMLRRRGPQAWLFKELRTFSTMSFSFQPKDEPMFYARRLAHRINKYDWADVLSAERLMTDYQPKIISDLMNYLVPSNVRIFLMSKSFARHTDRLEKYFSIEYGTEKIPAAKICSWTMAVPRPELQLPAPNPFVPTKLSMVPLDGRYTTMPNLLVDEPHSRVWFMQDGEYSLPRSMAIFVLRSPVIHKDPLTSGLIDIALMCFNDMNKEYFYPAVVADCSPHINSEIGGVYITIRGYNEFQQTLLEQMCERLSNFRIDERCLQCQKDIYIRSLRNFYAKQPHDLAMFYLLIVLTENYWVPHKLETIVEEGCTLEVCEARFKEVFSKFSVESLIYGSITADRARLMGMTVRNKLNAMVGEPRTLEQTPDAREYKLRDGEIYQLKLYSEVHASNAVVVYYQIGSRSAQDMRTEAMNDLFGYLLEEPCFRELRTRQQLGYCVWGGATETFGSFGIYVLVQSPKNPSYISDRIDSFINDSVKNLLEEMQPDDFEKLKEACVALHYGRPKNPDDRAALMSQELQHRTYLFTRSKLKSDEIEKFSKRDLIDFFRRYVARGASEQRQLVVCVESRSHPGERGPGIRPTRIIADVYKFKEGHDFI